MSEGRFRFSRKDDPERQAEQAKQAEKINEAKEVKQLRKDINAHISDLLEGVQAKDGKKVFHLRIPHQYVMAWKDRPQLGDPDKIYQILDSQLLVQSTEGEKESKKWATLRVNKQIENGKVEQRAYALGITKDSARLSMWTRRVEDGRTVIKQETSQEARKSTLEAFNKFLNYAQEHRIGR